MKTFLQRLGICIGGLLVLFVLFHLVENWRGKRAWTQWKQAREARGDSYDLARLAPPQVPDGENFARAPFFEKLVTPDPLNAGPKEPVLPTFFSKTGVLGDWRTGHKADLEGLQRELKLKSLQEILVPWEPELAALTEAAKRPHCRLEKDYADADTITPLLGMRSRARMLSFRALVSLRDRQPDTAMEDILTGLRVAAHLQQEPKLLSQLLRVAWVNILMQPIWEGLQEHRWNQAQLAKLQEALRPVDLVDSMSRAWHFEHLHMTNEFEKMAKTSPWTRLDRFEEEEQKSHRMGLRLRSLCCPKGWLYQNLLRATSIGPPNSRTCSTPRGTASLPAPAGPQRRPSQRCVGCPTPSCSPRRCQPCRARTSAWPVPNRAWTWR